MKNFKRFATLAMATTMVAGSAFSAVADEGGATGTGNYEGYIEEDSIFSVDVPTNAAVGQFNFFVDPNGLLAKTDYAHLGAAAEDFEEDATLFFTRTPKAAEGDTPAVVKYGKDSEAITLTNKSSYEVNVEVSATVTGADKITLGEISSDEENPTTDPTINLAIVSGDDSASINAKGGKLTGTIEGEAANFEVKWNTTSEKYEVAEKASDDDTREDWKTYSFHLTGACGGTWTAEQADVEPTVTLTWKVTDPKAEDYVMTAGANGTISYTFNGKPEGDVTALTINGTDRLTAYTAGNVTYNSETGVFSVNGTAATKTGLANGGKVVVTIGGKAYTLNYTK